MPLTADAVDALPDMSRLSHGFVGADLMDLVRRAGLNALRRLVGPGFAALPDSSDVQVRVDRDDLIAGLQQTAPSAMRETLTQAPEVGWADVGGLGTIVEQLRDVVEMPLKHPEAFARLQVRPSKGVLLYGPPGTGKTLLAKAVAKECGANFIPVNGPEIFSKWLGQSEEAVRHIFRMARQVAPAVVFFDQIDAIAPRRQVEAATPTSERVVNQLLAEMDGIQPSSQVVVLAATNRRDMLDPALLRHGRLGNELRVDLPHRAGREDILRLHLRDVPRDQSTDWASVMSWLAEQSEGFSGADLAALCEQAKLRALRRQEYCADALLAGSDLAAVFEIAAVTH
jgi:transitional endoplasmic reticulum ATPase